MNKYLRKLCEELAFQPLEFRDWDTDSMVGFLSFCYTEDHQLDSTAVRRCYEKLGPVFEGLATESSNELFFRISELCSAYELAAFTEGVKVGAALERDSHGRKIKLNIQHFSIIRGIIPPIVGTHHRQSSEFSCKVNLSEVSYRYHERK